MKPKNLLSIARLSFPLAIAIAALISAPTALAQSGTWTSTGAGPFNWSATTSWSGGTVATGVDNTASFTANITAAQTVNLDSARTIGNITFTDSTTSSHDLTISGANTLTLDRTTGIPIIDVTQSGRILTISSVIAGADGLQKNGAGQLTLSAANTYSGGTTLSAGTLAISNAASLGTAAVTVSGASTLRSAAAITYANAIAVNAGLTLSTSTTGSSTSTYSGLLSGSSAITLASNGLAGSNMATFAFTNAGNTFTGNVLLPSATGSSETFSFASIGDGGNFTFARPSWREMVIYTGAAPITFNTRQITLATTIGTAAGVDGNGNPVLQFSNNATNAANTVTFNTSMGMPASSATSAYFALGGTNTGNNTFAGVIGDIGGANTLGILKWDAGKWILSNASNAFEGNAWIANGTLSVNAISNAATDQPLGRNALILLGQQGNSGTLEFTGSSNSSTNKQFQIGNATAAQTGGGSILNNGSGTLTFTNSTFNTTITGITATRTLTIGGSQTGSTNVIQGIIQNNAASGLVALTKSGASTWALSGLNSFSGNISVTGGTLVGTIPGASNNSAFGSQSNTRTITVSSGATLRFDSGNLLTNNNFASTSVPTLLITGTASNNVANNNALNNVTLTGGTLTATAGSATYGAFNLNGTITSTGTSTISSSEPVNGRMMLSDFSTTFDVSSGTLTISAPLAAVTREGALGYLIKNGAGTLQLDGANTYSGSTTLNAGTTTVGTAGTLGSGTAALSVNGASTILNLSATLDTSVGSLSGTGVSTINTGGSGRNFTVNQTAAGTYSGQIAGAGNFTLGGLSTNTLTLAGPQTYTGATTVNGGTLRLAYSAGTSKLSDSSPLVLGGGTVDLSDSGTPHAEVVLSTTLTAGSASKVTRSSGTSTLQLNTITAGTGATLDFAADNIATTDNLNNPTTGILGTWATVGGVNWAVNSTNSADGSIIAYTGYTDVARLDGTPSLNIIADNPATNVRILEGVGSPTSLTLSSATTVVNSLLQSNDGAASSATINSGGLTFLTNAVLVASGAGSLTIGNGTFAAATTNGLLSLTNNSTSGLVIDSVIADNSGSSLIKSGTGPLTLSAVNTYAGSTSITGGTLTLTGSLTGGGAITISANASLSEPSTGVISGASSLSFSSTATSTLAGTNTHTGGTTLTSGTLILANTAALGTGTFTISGGTFNTDGVITSLAGNYPQVWNGSFSYGGASALDLGTSTIALTSNSRINIPSNSVTVGGEISGAFSLAKTGSGTLILNAANTHSGGTLLTGSGSAGTLVIGHNNALGTGPLTINANGTNTINTGATDITLATNNAQNWQASFTFTGTANLDMGTGPVTMLGNRTVTVAANTLTLGGAISGPGFGLTKNGAGTMVLNGSNTFTGNTTLSAGTLILGNLNALGSGTLVLGGGVLDTSVSNFINPKNNAQTWSGDFTVAGTNNLNLGTGAVTMSADRIVTVNANTLTVGGIGGGAALTKAGAGNLTITGSSTYTGNTTISDNSGTLEITGAGNLGGGTYAGAVSIGTGSTLRFSSSVASSSQTLSGVITGAGSLTLAPSVANANLTLSNAGNSYSGATNISGGRIASAPGAGISPNTSFSITGNSTSGGQLFLNATGTLANNLSIAGVGYVEADALTTKAGAIRLASGNTLSGVITLAGDARVGFITGTASATFSGQITGGNDIEFYGAASGNTATHTFTLGNTGTANNYDGDTIISSVDFSAARTGARAVLSLGANDQIPDGSGKGIVVFSGADANHISTLDLNGFNETINGVSNIAAAGANIRNNAAAASVLTIGAADTSSTFSGLISNSTGTLAITKIGTGTLTFSGANTYVGATTISAGTLILDNSLAIQNSPIDTLNSIAGDATNGLKTSATTLQFGGLTGNKNLADIFTTSSGGFSGITALTLRPGNFADSHVYTGVISDGAPGMTLNKTGAGAQTLSASNTYTGLTTIAAGSALVVAADGALGTTAAGTTVAANASLGFTGNVNYSTTELVSGAGAGTAGQSGSVLVGTRGFIQSVSGNNTFAGNIELNANGTSRIGSQDGASLTLTGAITQASGITTANLLFRVGNLNNNFVTLSNTGNSFGGDSSVFTSLAVTGQYAGLRIGANNAHPTNLTIQNFSSASGSSTALDLNGKNQELNGLSNGGAGTLNIINLDTVNASTLTLNPTVNKSSGTNIIIAGGSPGGTPLGVINLVKTGTFSQTLSGANSYTGTTTVNNGTLILGNASALGTSAATVNGGSLDLNAQNIANTVNVGTAGTLTGSGSTGAATLAGTVTPGGSGSGRITMASATVASSSVIALQLPATGTAGTNYDAITVSGALALDGTVTVNITGLTPALGQSFDLIDSTGPIDVTNFNVATDLVLPALPGGLAWNTSAFASTGVVSIVNGDPFIGWAASKGLTSGNNAKGDDPDGDGRNNLYEFAFDGDPLSAANDGKIVGKIATVGGNQVLTLTLPVRNGASFSASGGDQLSALIDAITYRIEGDVDLGTFNNTISEVTGGDATAIQAGLPALSTGWTYRTFRSTGTVSTVPKVFLRAKISE